MSDHQDPSPEQAIEQVTQSVPTGALQKSGIRKIRVLNASKLEDLIHQMVESRVDAFLSRQREIGIDGAVVPDPVDPDFDEKLQAYRRAQDEKLRRVEERLARLQGTFQGIESSIQRLSAENVLPAESATGD